MAKILAPILKKVGLYNRGLKVHGFIHDRKEWCSINITLPLLKRSNILRKIHYGLFSPAFNHEMEMYAHARHNYLSSRKKHENTVLMRRHIHGLEKGLMNEPMKEVFALDYIEETVEIFSKLPRTEANKPLLDWSHDVLYLYFTKVANHPKIQKAKHIFEASRYQKNAALHHTPFLLPVNEDGKAAEEAFEKLVRSRKTVRWFEKGRTPEREKIDKAIELASLAPSSCNRQPFEFRVFDKKELVDKIIHLAPGTRGFNENVPMVILINGKMNVSPSPGDRQLMYIDASLAAMNLMNALHSMGLASSAINWPDIKKLEIPIRKLVKMEHYTRPVMLLAVGYPHGERLVACSTRKHLDELRQYNQ